MSNDRTRDELVAGLLSQEKGITDARLAEYKTRLEEALAGAERRERRVRRAVYLVCGLLALTVAAILPLEGFIGLDAHPAVRTIWAACFGVLLVTAGVLLVLYNDKYRPAAAARRDDLQLGILADLQRQVARLSERLDKDHQ